MAKEAVDGAECLDFVVDVIPEASHTNLMPAEDVLYEALLALQQSARGTLFLLP